MRIEPVLALLPYLRPYRRRVLHALLALLTAAAAMLAIPHAFQRLIDHGFAHDNDGHIAVYFVALFAVSVVLAAATATRYYLMSWLGERVTADLRERVYANVIGLAPRFFETTRHGEVLSRLTTDTTLVQTAVGTSVSMGLRNTLLLAGGVVMLFVTSPRLAAYIFVLLFVVVLPLVVFGRRVRRLSRAAQDRVADSSAIAGEVLPAVATVQAYAQEAREAARYRSAVERAFDTARQRALASASLLLAVIVLVFGSVAFVLWLGAHDVLAGRMSAGQLAAFVLYAVIAAGSVSAIAEAWGDLLRASGALERLLELARTRSEIVAPQAPRAPESRGAIRFENVSFRYPSRPHTDAIADFTLEVQPGETLAIVGPSGAGKTTLFQLLLRFHDVSAGCIRVDGADLREYDPVELRGRIGFVAQDSTVFAASVTENIRYGVPDATDEEVRSAARVAAVEEFALRLPEGYDTALGERGVRLSGGQRQRVAIARALLKDPPILLLDEATSALDSESEAYVKAAIDRASRDRTVLVIAHRLSTVQSADRIVVLDRGRIQAIGTHAELIASCPLYARLAALQFAAPGAD